MDEKEILIAMKRIKKIEDEARKRLLTQKDKENKFTVKQMGAKISKSDQYKNTIDSSKNPKNKIMKIYCTVIKPNGVQCSKYQVEGCNKMCKQHHDTLEFKGSKETKVLKKVIRSKNLEDPLPPIPSYDKKETKVVPTLVKAKKKEAIPAAVKTLVWNKWMGEKVAEGGCYACRVTSISMRHHHVGHVVSEKHGGKCTIDNLRPVCANCNLSMGTMNMNEYIEKFGLHK